MTYPKSHSQRLAGLLPRLLKTNFIVPRVELKASYLSFIEWVFT